MIKPEDVDIAALLAQVSRLEIDVGRLQQQVGLLLEAVSKLIGRDKATTAQVDILTEVVNTHSATIDELNGDKTESDS